MGKGKYNDHFYRKDREALKRKVAAEGLPCYVCLQPIDLSLPAKHPMSFSADHIEPISTGGRIRQSRYLQTHMAHNSMRGNKPIDEFLASDKVKRLRGQSTLKVTVTF